MGLRLNISALFGGGKKLTYCQQFYEWINTGRNKDRIYGFPYTLGAWCNSRLKVNALQSIGREDNIREIVLPRSEKENEAGRERERERERFKATSPNGFPVQRVPWCNSGLKKEAIRQLNSRISHCQRTVVQQQSQTQLSTDFQSQSAEGIGVPNSNRGFSKCATEQGARKNIVQYLGIAADEPERIRRHTVPGKILPLVDIGWDEAYCRKWCEENDLLSPIYTTSTRGGCWFCHNQGVDQLRLLRNNYPELWQLLLKWDKDSPTTFKSDGHTVHDYERRFQAEDAGVIKAGDKKFRWKQIIQPEENLEDEKK